MFYSDFLAENAFEIKDSVFKKQNLAEFPSEFWEFQTEITLKVPY